MFFDQEKFDWWKENILPKEPELEDLFNLVGVVSQIFQITGMVVYGILTIAVYYLIGVLCKQGALQKQLLHVKVGLAAYAFYAPFCFSLFIAIHLTEAFVDVMDNRTD